jgi:SNF2 family DNA or RNA helicase
MSPRWKDLRFDYVILDEAQAIKNAASESAKAARLLRADHRLALSGTPVQNHLGELWSLFEFLNPGMLGASRAFTSLTGASAARRRLMPRQFLAKALRPFILRRTKEQVARICRRNSSRRSSANWISRSASFTTSCASTTANRC